MTRNNDLMRPPAATPSLADPNATTGGDAAPPAAAPAAPRRYDLGEEVARGGMGVVYRATDTTLGREVAVKVLQGRFGPGSAAARRFHDEARITAQLQHPNIPPVHDLGALPDGRPFLAMKLIKGQTLDELLGQRADSAADRGRFVAAFEQACQAVAYAHAHGVIHRDLKPANVMVGSFGEVQVMDWGLAKVLGDASPAPAGDPGATAAATEVGRLRDSEGLLTQDGSVLGTPAYMPPEQALGAVNEVDRRSDVFGLGGILAAVLTGRPPFVGKTAETTRVMAARGETYGCFERLDACGAEPELVALCKRCLAPKREDRPADAGEVAREVAALRQAAEERARRAELDKVRAEGEAAAAAAASAERRKRRRVWAGAAAALVLAAVGGLSAVLYVQRTANAELEAKNEAVEAERAKVEQRFDMAKKAIAAFHTTIDEQPELGNEAFRPLRKKLLGSAAGFYRELEGLLAGEADPKSRAALADGYFQLAELTEKIGDQREALAVYRKALVIRRELAALPGANADARVALPVTLLRVGIMLAATGDTAGALRAYEESRDVAAALAAEAPTDAARQALASGHHGIGTMLSRTGKPAEALAAYQRARNIRRELADAHPAVTAFQSDLAQSYNAIGIELQGQMGKPAEALAAFQESLAIRQRLADAHPAVTAFQNDLAKGHYNLAVMLRYLGRPGEALAPYEKARDIYLKLADDHPAVTQFQHDVATSHQSIGWLLGQMGKREKAVTENMKSLVLLQRLADVHPTVTAFQSDLAQSHHINGVLQDQIGRQAEALAAFERARDLWQKLADAQPAVSQFRRELGYSLYRIGELSYKAGRPGEALAAYEKARDIYQKLADAQPTVPRCRADLATAHNRLGRLLAREGRLAEAFAALDAGLAIREKLLAATPTSTNYMSDLGYSHAYRGWARLRAGRPKGAASDLRKAVELWAKNTAADAEKLFEKARALALLANLGSDSRSGVSADEVKNFADRAVAALAGAVKAGWRDRLELRAPDFDSVRGRAEFRALQAELAATSGPERLPMPRRE